MGIIDEIMNMQREKADRASAQRTIRASILSCIRQEKVSIDRAIELVREKTTKAVTDNREQLLADVRVEEPGTPMETIEAALAQAMRETTEMIDEALAGTKEAFEGLRDLVHIDEAYDRKPIV